MDEPWPWPASLDALTAAPETDRELFENDAVRVLETRSAPPYLHVIGFELKRS